MPPRGFFRIFMIQGFKNKIKEELRKKGVEGKEEIYVFYLEDCAYCDLLKKSLSRLKVPFKQVNIDKHPQLGDQLETRFGSDGYYPIITYGDKTFLPHTHLAPSDSLRIFQTIDEALEILLKEYYEI